jgi:hypothetical protein
LGNAGYIEKQGVYRNSQFQITRGVAERYDEWDEAKIEARQKSLAEIAATVWKIN